MNSRNRRTQSWIIPRNQDFPHSKLTQIITQVSIYANTTQVKAMSLDCPLSKRTAHSMNSQILQLKPQKWGLQTKTWLIPSNSSQYDRVCPMKDQATTMHWDTQTQVTCQYANTWCLTSQIYPSILRSNTMRTTLSLNLQAQDSCSQPLQHNSSPSCPH